MWAATANQIIQNEITHTMKLKNILIILTALAFLAGAPLTHAGWHYWTGAGANKLWSNPLNWENYYVPVVGEADLSLNFYEAASYESVIDIPGLTVKDFQVWTEDLVLYQFSATNGAKLQFAGADVSISTPAPSRPGRATFFSTPTASSTFRASLRFGTSASSAAPAVSAKPAREP